MLAPRDIYIIAIIGLFFIIFAVVASIVARREHFLGQAEQFPRIIWTYWVTGAEDMPEVVKRCIDTWTKHNPDYSIRIMSRQTYRVYLPDLNLDQLRHNDSPARESDFMRLALLSKYGGFWMDASTICTAPLKWIQDLCKTNNKQMFGYYLPGFTSNDKYPVIESWIFACTKESSFVKAWSNEFYSMNNYPSVNAYVEAARKDTDLQKIDLPEYLAIHVAAQRVLQRNKNAPYTDLELVSAIQATNGPLHYLSKVAWSSEDAIKSICTNQTSLVKLRGNERRVAQRNLIQLDCIFKK